MHSVVVVGAVDCTQELRSRTKNDEDATFDKADLPVECNVTDSRTIVVDKP
jgi:hypothetical protein